MVMNNNYIFSTCRPQTNLTNRVFVCGAAGLTVLCDVCVRGHAMPRAEHTQSFFLDFFLCHTINVYDDRLYLRVLSIFYCTTTRHQPSST